MNTGKKMLANKKAFQCETDFRDWKVLKTKYDFSKGVPLMEIFK